MFFAVFYTVLDLLLIFAYKQLKYVKINMIINVDVMYLLQ